MKNPGISVVIGFRNRELARVKNSLDSLAKQTFVDFELIFIDYGSDELIAIKTKELVSMFCFAKYYYSDTRGWYWNRAHALNTGIKLSSGKLIIISDIDLILPGNYLEQVSKFTFTNQFYTFSCYYLQRKTDYSNLLPADLKDINYVGLCAVTKDDIGRICGFDEYYMNWGCEDDDFNIRLENIGCKRKHIGVEQCPALHQWHEKHTLTYPTPWYLEMINYLYAGQVNKNGVYNYGALVDKKNRTVLNKINNGSNFIKLALFPNPLFQYNLFLDAFFKMEPDEFGEFELTIQPTIHQVPRSRKQQVVDSLNALLAKWEYPYIIEKNDKQPPLHSKESWDNFIMYFIGKNRSYIRDYYILNTGEKQAFYFQKL